MSQVIWKKALESTDYQIIEIPEHSEILCVQNQNENPCIWFKCQDDEKETETFAFRVIGTGHKFNDHIGDYVGTFQMHGGALVFHVFKEKI